MATKFYLHDAATGDTGTLPGAATISASTPGATATGAYTNRSMDGTIGSSQTSAAKGTGSWDGIIMRRFLSAPLAAQTISGTVARHYAGKYTSGSYAKDSYGCLGVWRPSTGALVGRLKDQIAGLNNFTTSEGLNTASSANAIASLDVLDGDVLVFEMSGRTLNSTLTVYYDGTTEDSTTSNAAYILFSGTIAMLGAGGFAHSQAVVIV